MNRMLRNTVVLALFGVFAVAATGCNTIKGVGKDTEKVGEEIQEEAEEHDRSQSESKSDSQTDSKANPAEPAKQAS